MSEPIAFEAEVRQVRTMADGSVNIILNIPEPYREEAKRFMDWHHLLVGVSAVVIDQTEFDDDDRGKHRKIHF